MLLGRESAEELFSEMLNYRDILIRSCVWPTRFVVVGMGAPRGRREASIR
jgi:hypothetical protein